ncbi:hypothetical protein IQ17_07262 [Bradyrhizobium daqingense]|uniref:Uncharacterized protein n=1 Tax=Bradyrhizobium daqingense TaxID=993502 RepID=A0A562K9H0_9BRAD|nr:hypothetical protein IQ17_07262 [Bradyrhizobium daqingense]
MQMSRQALDDAALVDLTPLDRRVTAEGLADRLRQRLRTIDNEEAADSTIEPKASQVVHHRLHNRSILGGVFDNRQRMVVAFAVDSNGGDQRQLIADMQPIDLDGEQIDPTTSMRPSAPPTTRRPARDGRLGSPVAHFLRECRPPAGGPRPNPRSRRSATSGSSLICRAMLCARAGAGRRTRRCARPLYLDPPAVEALPPSAPPPVLAGPLVQSPKAWPAQPLAILFDHLRKSRDPGRQAEKV